MAVLLLATATLCSALLDAYASLTSQAMRYLLVIVIAAYRLDWVPWQRSRRLKHELLTALLPVGQPERKIFWRHGSGNEIPLGNIAMVLAQKIPVSQVFDPFGHGFHRQLFGQAQAGIEHGTLRVVVPSPVDKALVNFEFIKRDVA